MPRKSQDGCVCCGAHPVYENGLCRPCWLRNEKYGSPEPVTIGINELLSLFRDYEIPCGYPAMVALIDGGKLPFAYSAIHEESKHRTFIIFRRRAVEWLEAMTK